jgi:cell division protein FtsB
MPPAMQGAQRSRGSLRALPDMSRNGRTPQRGARPRNTRPGQRGGVTRPRTTTQESRPRPRFTSRAAILVLVFAVLVVSYASSMRAYLQQHDHIDGLKAEIASSQQQIGELQREKRRWNDKAYVEAQARQRFGWVLPGEVGYQVIGRDGKPLAREDELTDPSTVARSVPDAWWSTAYGSLQAADHPKKKAPVPASRITPPATPKKQ